jgi:uncharacterized NAD(P)/FAD-binding protein YdhS
MKSDRAVPVAIIGGGFSGTILAAQLARRGIHSVLIDGSGRVGRGVAYSTKEPAHLLNLRAEGMSAWAGEPAHFTRRFETEGGDARGFAERRFFARYVGDILDEAVGSGNTEIIEDFAVKASRGDGTWRVDLRDGGTIEARAVVLAIGNQEPEPLRAFLSAGPRYIRDPWGSEARAAVEDLAATGERALLVGTGLTMVDLALSLDSAGYRGRAVALSRRGQIPRSHADFDPAPVELDEVPSGTLLGLWRWLRKQSGQVGWRAAIDSLRPHSHALWQGLDGEQQQRFLRHARPWWDVHRHRIAPQVGRTITGMIAGGHLEVMAGRVVTASSTGDALEVDIRKRGASHSQTMRFAYVFNCTGPLHSIGRTREPVLRSLLDRGLLRPDHLGIGLEVDASSRAAGADRLWALGPLTKGRYWEIIAVPDIREQAAAVAEDIARELTA